MYPKVVAQVPTTSPMGTCVKCNQICGIWNTGRVLETKDQDMRGSLGWLLHVGRNGANPGIGRK